MQSRGPLSAERHDMALFIVYGTAERKLIVQSLSVFILAFFKMVPE